MLPADEKGIAAYVTQLIETNYGRLLNRFFRGTVTAGNTGGWPYTVQVVRTGDTVPDGNDYPVALADYAPQTGDVVDLMWRDQATAYVVALVAPASKPSRMIDSMVLTEPGDFIFASIPPLWTHLELFATLQTDQGSSQVVFMQYNGDVSGNYVYSVDQIIAATGSASQALAGSTSQGRIATAATYKASNRITIFDYASGATIDGFKHATNLAVRSDTGGVSSETYAMEWRPSAAQMITQVRLVAATGGFTAGSSARLYGIS